jgi:hypothetical protein
MSTRIRASTSSYATVRRRLTSYPEKEWPQLQSATTVASLDYLVGSLRERPALSPFLRGDRAGHKPGLGSLCRQGGGPARPPAPPDNGLGHEPLLSLAADAETQKTALNLPRCGHTCIHPASRPARNTHRWAADRYTTEVLAVPRSQ